MANISTIGTGKDYTNLIAWEAALPSTLTQDEIAECFAEQVHEDRLYLDGPTTAADKRMIIRPATGQETSYAMGSGPVIFSDYGGWGMIRVHNGVNHLEIIGMELSSAAGGATTIIDNRSSPAGDQYILFKDCYIYDPTWKVSTTHQNNVVESLNDTITFRNCLIVGMEMNEANIDAENVTIIGNIPDTDVSNTGFTGGALGNKIYCAHFGPTSSNTCFGTTNGSSADLASEDGSGSTGLTNLALADQYTDPANEDWSFKAGNGLEGAGTGGTDIGFVVPSSEASLVVGEASHANSSDNAILTQVHSIVLTDGLSGHAVDSAILAQVHNLTADEAFSDHITDNLIIDVSAGLILQEATHTHVVDSLAFSQNHGLILVDTDHGFTSDNINVVQSHNVVIAAGLSTHSSDNVVIGLGGSLGIESGSHGHAVDAITVSQIHAIEVSEANHSHAGENIELDVFATLNIAEATHGLSSDNFAIAVSFGVNDSRHIYDSEDITLGQLHNLAGMIANHGLRSENIDLAFVAGLWREQEEKTNNWQQHELETIWTEKAQINTTWS